VAVDDRSVGRDQQGGTVLDELSLDQQGQIRRTSETTTDLPSSTGGNTSSYLQLDLGGGSKDSGDWLQSFGGAGKQNHQGSNLGNQQPGEEE
jgi:hypothetical protein